MTAVAGTFTTVEHTTPAPKIDHTVAMGLNGAEFFHHPWELSVRAAKGLPFTAEAPSAVGAHRLGPSHHPQVHGLPTDPAFFETSSGRSARLHERAVPGGTPGSGER